MAMHHRNHRPANPFADGARRGMSYGNDSRYGPQRPNHAPKKNFSGIVVFALALVGYAAYSWTAVPTAPVNRAGINDAGTKSSFQTQAKNTIKEKSLLDLNEDKKLPSGEESDGEDKTGVDSQQQGDNDSQNDSDEDQGNAGDQDSEDQNDDTEEDSEDQDDEDEAASVDGEPADSNEDEEEQSGPRWWRRLGQ